MSSLEKLNLYLREIERRLRWRAFSRGAALTAAVALAATVLLVLFANSLAFSAPSILWSRVLLFLALALAAAFGLVIPLVRLNRARAARHAEKNAPELEERLLTLAEKNPEEQDPFLDLLASETVEVIERTPDRSAGKAWTVALLSAMAGSVAVLVWLIGAGPGFLGYGAALLWAGPAKTATQPFYDVVVTPGNRTVRRKSDQMITAKLVGFQTDRVRLLARFRGTSKWEEAVMQPQTEGPGYQFLFAAIPEALDYYVVAGGVRSQTYTLNVADLPAVKRIRVTYHYPAWTGLGQEVEDPGGDLRAVGGTQAEVAIETDRPLNRGAMILDSGEQIALDPKEGNWRTARITLNKDGLYHIAALEQQETVRLSDDYFIEVRNDSEPTLRITRPGRDARVSPIEEVTVAAQAEDDFGLENLEIHYSVNGSPEKTAPLLQHRGAKEAAGSATLYLEDYKLVPGDVVSVYATARDAHSTVKSDMYFLAAEPFEREYSQSQQAGGGGGEGGNQDENRVSDRQKEIIAATWNQIRDKGDKTAAAENGKFLAGVQQTLRDQAKSLANRMRSRELSGTNQEFQNFSQEMEKAAEAMGPASEKLKALQWQPALEPEQKALQHLMRAEAMFRRIQVAFGRSGGSGGRGGSMGRDLENLFDLELDTEKNQYETGQQSASAGQREREIDEALQKLEQLARRQQQLAQQQARQQQSFQQRWQQEMLRREAEQLQRRMEQLSRGGQQQSGQQQSGQQQSGQQQSGHQASGRQSGGQQAMGRQSGGDPRLQQALERLSQATRDMAGRQSEAEMRRAAERLDEARRMLEGMRRQESSSQLDDLVRRADKLSEQQQDFDRRLRSTFSGQSALRPGSNREQAQQVASEKEQMAGELERLERGMQDAARSLAGTQRSASSKVREALGNMQQQELRLRMKYNAEAIRRGYGPFVAMREAPVTQGLRELQDRLHAAQSSLDRNAPQQQQQGNVDRALAQVEQLRRQLERMAAQGDPQQQRQGMSRGEGQRGQENPGGRQGGTEGPGSYSAMNRGDWQLPDPGNIGRGASGDAFGRADIEQLSRLRQALRDDPEAARDLQELIREMQRLDPSRFPGNPQLVERIRAQILPRLEQIELQLRRKLEDEQAGQVRTTAPDRVPPGYAEAVAEYFRRLSKTR